MDADFEVSHMNILRRFNRFFRQNYADLFPNIRRSNISLFLVSIRPVSANTCLQETRICLNGLSNESEIVAYPRVLSQKRCVHHYEPLKLCYNKGPVTLTAGEDANVAEDNHRVTPCGSVLNVHDGLLRYHSTIGGIVQLNDRYYAVTIRHNSASRDFDEPHNSDICTLWDDEKVLDDESILILDNWDRGTTEASINQPIKSISKDRLGRHHPFG
jgi:hypothetical protein